MEVSLDQYTLLYLRSLFWDKYKVRIDNRCGMFACEYGDDCLWFWIKRNRTKVDLETKLTGAYNFFVNIKGVWVRKNFKQFESVIKKFVKNEELEK